jgi:hypothetical protein
MKGKKMAQKTINIRFEVSVEEHAKWKKAAEEDDRSLSGWARTACREKLARAQGVGSMDKMNQVMTKIYKMLEAEEAQGMLPLDIPREK